MRIKSIEIGSIGIPLLKPFKTAMRTVFTLESIVIRIVTNNGLIGYGETAPTEAITGDTREGIVRALERLSDCIIAIDLNNKESLLEIVHGTIKRNFNAKSAIEIALYDLWAQEAKMPLYRYLGGERRVFKTGVTISLNRIDTMTKDALEAAEKGFESLKIKLGDDPDMDILRIEAIFQALRERISLKLDANQGWSPEETVMFLSSLEQKGIPTELIEQPVKGEDIAGLHYIRQRTTVPLLADESVFSPEDTRRLLEAEAVDRINIKLDKCGGISKALEIADICHTYDVECMMGCMMEGAISVGAAAHVASAKTETITMYDLDAPILCSEAPVQGGVLFDGADIRLSEKSGLGISHVANVKWLSKIEK